MGKNEIHWALFSGAVLLPFSIRTTRKQCIRDSVSRSRDSDIAWKRPLSTDEEYWETLQRNGHTVKKIVINLYE